LLYIVTALKAEAQAFVDRYKLTKSKLSEFTLFSNQKLMLIISGIGVENARKATQALINHYDITDEDSYYNIGVCGASKTYSIGQTLQIGSIVYQEERYTFDTKKKEIVCVDTAYADQGFEIVDMESFGFYDAVIHNPAIKNFAIIKVVSDHFEPQSVTKDASKALLFHAIKDIF